jgi:2-amino-4-hydroxy-6-hydroxymethyldihydropteridine diphosphokinase
MNNLTAYIALGSNLNDPIAQLHIALTHIAKIPCTYIDTCSAFYRTRPVGYLDQPDFINAVVAVCTTLSAHDLLSALKAIEIQQGRIRILKNGPRTIDLDLLLYGNIIINEPDFIVPHPRMLERAFVLKPLADVAPALVLPDGKTVSMHLQQHHYDFIKVEMVDA